MPTKIKRTRESEVDILLEGQKTIEVSFEDERPNETVTLKRIGFSKTKDFLENAADLPKQTLMSVVSKDGQPYDEEWFDSLDVDSQEKLVARSLLINEKVLKKSLRLHRMANDLIGSNLGLPDTDPNRGRADLLKILK